MITASLMTILINKEIKLGSVFRQLLQRDFSYCLWMGWGKKEGVLKRFSDVFSHPVDILRARYKMEFM